VNIEVVTVCRSLARWLILAVSFVACESGPAGSGPPGGTGGGGGGGYGGATAGNLGTATGGATAGRAGTATGGETAGAGGAAAGSAGTVPSGGGGGLGGAAGNVAGGGGGAAAGGSGGAAAGGGAGALAGDGGGAGGGFAPFLEWRIPFDDAQPLQIAATPGAVYYMDFVLRSIGRLDLASSRVTQWFPKLTTSSPGDIELRSSDGTLFVTSSPADGHYEIGHFDPSSRIYRHWEMPPALAATSDLALDGQGRVLFAAMAKDGAHYVIGRLDASTNVFTTWPIPDSMVPPESYANQVATAPDGSVFFNIGGFTARGVAHLNVATGVFTMWTAPHDVVFAIALDASGAVIFQQQATGLDEIARLIPGTGQLTEWVLPYQPSDDFALYGGRLFSGGNDPAGLAPSSVSALDLSRPAADSVVTPRVADPVTPSSTQVQPQIDEGVLFEQGDAQVTVSPAAPVSNGAFTEWTAPLVPTHFSAVVGDAVYFSEQSAPVIGRLAP